jgi:hypothetical protein
VIHRRHLRSTAIGYVALLVALTTGSAYALDGHNTVYSDDIVNGQVSSNDLHDNAVGTTDVRDDTLTGGGLAAVDLAPNAIGSSEVANSAIGSAEVSDDSLGGADINEAGLGEVLGAKLGGFGRGTGGGTCDPSSASYADCVIVTINLPAPAHVLLIGAIRGYGPGFGYCQLASNAGFILPNSIITVDGGDDAALTGITGVETAGSHDYAIDCNQVNSDVGYIQASLSAVAISPD